MTTAGCLPAFGDTPDENAKPIARINSGYRGGGK